MDNSGYLLSNTSLPDRLRTTQIGRFLVLGSIISLLLASAGCRFASNSQNALGAQLYEQGQYSIALQHFQKVVNNDPQNADGYYNLAATTHRLGVQRRDQQLITQAEALYNQCLDFAPNHVECHRGLAVLLADTGRPDRAFALMKNWAARNPQYAEPRVELARLYEESGDDNQALRNLEDAILRDTANTRAWLALARLRERNGDLSQALENYQQVLRLNVQNPMAVERVAALSRQLNSNYDASIAAGQRRMASQPNFESGFIRR